MQFALSMKNLKHLYPISLGIFLGIFMTACSEQKTTEVALKPIPIQGSSFNESANSQENEDSTSHEINLSQLTTATLSQETATIAIAKIPTATPVPTYSIRETTKPVETVSAPPVKSGEYSPTPFEILSSYKYVEPIPQEGEKPEEVEKRRLNNQIPPNILALNDTKSIVEGWMVPMEVRDDGTVKSFILVKTQPQCCFGDTQAMNEWVDVTVNPGTRVDFNVDTPIKVYGQLEVGEKTDEGFVISIYRMKADKVEG